MLEINIAEELQKITRRLTSIESNDKDQSKRLDLLYADREIFENIAGRLALLEEQFKLSRQHDETVRRDIKEEIGSHAEEVKATVKEATEGLRPLIRGGRENIKKPFWKVWR